MKLYFISHFFKFDIINIIFTYFYQIYKNTIFVKGYVKGRKN